MRIRGGPATVTGERPLRSHGRDGGKASAEIVGIEHDHFLLGATAWPVGLCTVPTRREASLVQGFLELDACPDVSDRDQNLHS